MLAAGTLASRAAGVQVADCRVPAGASFWYAGSVRSSVSIALFFLLSAFFLATLLGAIEHSRKLLAAAGGCLAAVVCIIVFLTPVDLPDFNWGRSDDKPNPRASSTVVSTAPTSTQHNNPRHQHY